MNILAAADIHGQLEWYKALLAAVGPWDAQAVVLAGDLLGYAPGHEHAQDAQRINARDVFGLLQSSAAPVLYVLGNDDLVDLGPDTATLRSLHGRRIDLGPYNFVGYRFTLPFMGGDSEKPEEEIARDLEGLLPLADSRTIFVTHSPAKGRLDLTMLDTHAGSASIRDFVERTSVRAHIHGHLHSGFGRAGRHFNVAACPKATAMLIDLDRMTYRVLDLAAGDG